LNSFKLPQDILQHLRSPQQRIIIPVAPYTVPRALQNTCTPFIVDGLFDVLPTIQFDYQLQFHAQEIDDIATQWHLPPELEASQLLQSQVLP
jgi:hypothetical protein